jgi:hypothetical protein
LSWYFRVCRLSSFLFPPEKKRPINEAFYDAE